MNLSNHHNTTGHPVHPVSPRRRQPALQPPNLLTTSLENARNATLGAGGAQQTPLSTATTLSSPFSAYPHSAHPSSASSAMSANSPLVVRQMSSTPTQYNPQQWGPMSNASPQSAIQQSQHHRVIALAPRPTGPDEPVVSPPPPYSPRREPEAEASPHNLQNATSPSDTTSSETETSRHTTPLTSAHALSPDFSSNSRHSAARPYHSSSTRASPNIASTPAFLPPSSTQGSASNFRSSSRDHAGRLLSSLTSRNRSNASSPVNAADALQLNTTFALEAAPLSSNESPTSRAPAARRAASTGDISVGRGSTPLTSQSPPAWEPGMPLPPPPPGPPPSAARTQSLNRPIYSPSLERGPTLPLSTRRPPGQGTSLDTVPPTPADWREESGTPEQSTRDRSNGPGPLHLDTGSILQRNRLADPGTASASTPSQRRRDSSSGGLVRTPAVRNRTSMGLRERRSESKQGRERGSESEVDEDRYPWEIDQAQVKPSDLDLMMTAKNSTRRRDTSRRTPGSGSGLQDRDGRAVSRKARADDIALPLQETSRVDDSARSSTPTPPASAKESEHPTSSTALRPKRSHRLSQKLSLAIGFTSDQRPVSHILHTPNPEDALQVPLTPSGQAKQRPVSDLLGPESPRAFAERAVERHRNFANREATARNDSERLELFIRFIVAESKIRREQYEQAFQAEDLDMMELAKELFQRIPTQQHELQKEPAEPHDEPSRPASTASSAFADLSSQDEASSVSRKQDSPSSATSAGSIQPPVNGGMKDFVPCLSPIASMSIATGQDDDLNSRGRPPSRWWETPSQSESGGNDGFSVLGRTKRESKYMGVPKEARNSGNVFTKHESTPVQNPQWQTPEVGQLPNYGTNEYPPEKVGWHEDMPVAVPPPPKQPPTPAPAPPFTPDARGLDISRLVTLPPPYPRHHPAVNNNHPDLAEVRSVVRSLHQVDEPESIRDTYQSEIQVKRKRASSWCEHQRSLHRQDVQYRIENDQMTQEQYDELETELEGRIQRSEREITQTDFDTFQNLMVSPLHALYAERIALSTSTIERLSSALFTAAQSHSPNLPQEEGDEQPELLEKLTQLKWLFEGRETLHRRTYDLLSERNGKYKGIVILPYKQSSNQSKMADAERFFAQDTADRRKAFEKAVADRAQDFLTVIEHNVARGLEMQLDAFWQIGPSLSEVLHKIPHDLTAFEVRIPVDEYEENPSYYKYPLQYLSSLLSHAEKATYQFIESQVNLLCLLHEIRSCALSAKCKAEANEGRLSDVDAYQSREERRLTADLKERVGDVEGQWADALGEELRSVRERARERLLEDGGWDDEAEEL